MGEASWRCGGDPCKGEARPRALPNAAGGGWYNLTEVDAGAKGPQPASLAGPGATPALQRPLVTSASHPVERLAGWGRRFAPGTELRGEDLEALTQAVPLSRGLGRSYGDSSLPPASEPKVAGTTLADRVLAFEPSTGRMRAEAGLSLDEILRLWLPQGWFPPVTPGTRFVTLGGMVASDVHGKNHHVAGCFGAHVAGLRLRVGNGAIVECSPSEHPELFWATVGGMGLTGHILEVEFTLERVPSRWIWQESERIGHIDEFVAKLKDNARAWPMTMGWIDCLSRGANLGRGILIRGRWATAAEAPRAPPAPKRRLSVPMVLPQFVLSPLTVRAFNFLYYWRHLARTRQALVAPDTFFYPLDAIGHWNRMYGPQGFTQYQCVLPESAGPQAARRFLEVLTRRGGASFLCVIKDCGAQGQGLLSFPCAGISIALDIPVRPGTQALIDGLNDHVIAEGGRVYLTKDTFTRPEHFAAMEPRLAEFQAIRRRWDPEQRVRSAQSIRLLGDRP